MSDTRLKAEYLRNLELKMALKKGLPHLYGFPFYKWQRKFWDSRNKYNFITAANQIGKCLLSLEKLPTPTGWKYMKDISVGEEVFGRDGRPTKVIAIPFVGEDDFYRITFNDHTWVDASANHVWTCKGYDQRFRKRYKARNKVWDNPGYGQWIERNTKEIIEQGGYQPETKAGKRFVIPVSEAVEYEEKQLFDPYYIGLWIGNGSNLQICFHSDDVDLVSYANRYGNCRAAQPNKKLTTIGISKDWMTGITDLGILKHSNEKFIPSKYLLGSIEQRKALLAGLLDTDGCFDKNGHTTFATTSERLSKQFEELVCSLGGLAQTRIKKAGYKKDGEFHDCNDCYETMIWTKFNPFRSIRKASKWFPRTRDAHERVIIKIEYIGKQQGKCLTVDNADGTFLCTQNYTVTHNSSINIRKCIHWATEPSLWPDLWSKKPTQFWYFYPDANLATAEFKEKWVKEYLPSGMYQDHPQYGWKAEFDTRKKIHAIHFNTGLTVYFKTYEQKLASLQAVTLFAVFVDEEMPPEFFPEINMRLIANNGYWHKVFTATLGSEFWRQTMEMQGTLEEKFPGALKLQISMYDCLKYEDGSPSGWTKERIEDIKKTCSSDAEVQRRIYGKFVKASGLVYPWFNRNTNVIADKSIPNDWYWVAGVDPGSGGLRSHPAAIVLVAISPDHRKAKLAKCRRYDGIETTAHDVLNEYKQLAQGIPVLTAKYDWACKDFAIISGREGMSFAPAQKDRSQGIALLNSLFKNRILEICQDAETEKLMVELENLDQAAEKSWAKDDLIDALRYAVVGPPWDFSEPDKTTHTIVRGDGRRRRTEVVSNAGVDLLIEDIEMANYEYENLGF